MKKSDLILIFIGLFFWITGQIFILTFFSFEDFLIGFVLGFIDLLTEFLIWFSLLFLIARYFFVKYGKSDELILHLSKIKAQIDSIFQKRVQSAFWLQLPESYKIGTKNLKNTYNILWASIAFCVYFLLNALINIYYAEGYISIKFIFLAIITIFSVWAFIWFSFVTLLSFLSYILETIIIITKTPLKERIQNKIRILLIQYYPILRPFMKGLTLVVSITIFIISPILILVGILSQFFSNQYSDMINEFIFVLKETDFLTFFIIIFVLDIIVIAVWNFVTKPNDMRHRLRHSVA
jgi:hypothetical protein